MAFQMETGCRYFTESCQTITTHATITDRIYPSVFTITITNRYIYQYLIEFSNIYRPCHNHRRIFCWWLPWKYRRNDFVGNVLTRIFFLSCFAVCKIVGGWFFFIFDRISDEMGYYQRSVFRWKDSVGKNVTDGFRALHRRI